MTWFGYLWLVLTVFSTGFLITKIGEPREPLSWAGFVGSTLATYLIFLGAATVGVFR